MKVIILTKNYDTYFSKRMPEEGKNLGIDVQLINPLECMITHKQVVYKGEALNDYSAVILRTPPYREERDYFHLVARMMEMQGLPVINTPDAVEISGNKFSTSAILSAALVPVLTSVAVRVINDLDNAADICGGYPVFLKTMFGTRGIGVIYCPCRETLRAAAQAMWAYGANLIVEKFAKKSMGETVRIFVFDGRILGAVRNRAYQNEIHQKECPLDVEAAGNDELENKESRDEITRLIRSNFSRGGIVESYKAPGSAAETAVSACEVIGISMGGVDLIEDETGWKVLEINSAPGIKGFETATGLNLAAEILKGIQNKYGLNQGDYFGKKDKKNCF